MEAKLFYAIIALLLVAGAFSDSTNQLNGPGNVVIQGHGNLANGKDNTFDGNHNRADGNQNHFKGNGNSANGGHNHIEGLVNGVKGKHN